MPPWATIRRKQRVGNGAFTKAIVEGIQLGKADLLGNGFITTSSLDTFVEHRVRALTEDKQNPVMGRPPDEPDFAISADQQKMIDRLLCTSAKGLGCVETPRERRHKVVEVGEAR